MARDTGGELFQNTNDLAAAMARMLRRTERHLPAELPARGLAQDGSFHPLKVRLKGAPRGARVHHRAGYYAPDPAARRPLEQRLRAAAAILGGEEGGDLPLSALALPLPRGGGGGAAARRGGRAGAAGRPRRAALAVEIYAYALGAEGAVAGFLTQRLDLDLAKVADELRASGLKFYGELELPPGAYTLRVLVRTRRRGAHALRSVPVEVPAAPQLSPPLFVAAAGGGS